MKLVYLIDENIPKDIMCKTVSFDNDCNVMYNSITYSFKKNIKYNIANDLLNFIKYKGIKFSENEDIIKTDDKDDTIVIGKKSKKN